MEYNTQSSDVQLRMGGRCSGWGLAGRRSKMREITVVSQPPRKQFLPPAASVFDRIDAA